MNSTLSTFNTMTEVPLSKALNPQLLPGRWSNGCPLLRVCVHSVSVHSLYSLHLDGLNAEDQFRVWVTIHYYIIIRIEMGSVQTVTIKLEANNSLEYHYMLKNLNLYSWKLLK